jgi:Uma2 family endonuclease
MVQLLRKKFTVVEFQQMAESGIIQDEDRLELIEGELIEMGKIGKKHAACVDRLNDLFRDKFGKRVLVRSQNPIELSSYSQPQPDLAILRRKDDYYETGHPQPKDIFLLVEVADTTIESDREIKVPLYARHGVFEVWLVNLNDQVIEVYREPNSSGFQYRETLAQGQTISPIFFSDIGIVIDEIFA